MAIPADGGGDALNRLRATDPPLYLSPSPDLSQAARLASQQLFSLLKPFTQKSPFDRLLVDGFDAEQIWQQIDIQSQPLISTIGIEVKKLEKYPEELSKLFEIVDKRENEFEARGTEDGLEDDDEDMLEDSDEEDEDEDGDDDEMEGGNEGEEDEEEEEEDEGVGVEDKFLKIKELEEYLEDDEAREYGGTTNKKSVKKAVQEDEVDGDDDDDDDEVEDGDDDEVNDWVYIYFVDMDCLQAYVM